MPVIIQNIDKFCLSDVASVASGYHIHGTVVPSGLPVDHPIREEFDDRYIDSDHGDGTLWIRVYFQPTSEYVGFANFAVDGLTLVCDNIWIKEEHRGFGLATRIYDLAEMRLGLTAIPSLYPSRYSLLFWRDRWEKTRYGWTLIFLKKFHSVLQSSIAIPYS